MNLLDSFREILGIKTTEEKRNLESGQKFVEDVKNISERAERLEELTKSTGIGKKTKDVEEFYQNIKNAKQIEEINPNKPDFQAIAKGEGGGSFKPDFEARIKEIEQKIQRIEGQKAEKEEEIKKMDKFLDTRNSTEALDKLNNEGKTLNHILDGLSWTKKCNYKTCSMLIKAKTEYQQSPK